MPEKTLSVPSPGYEGEKLLALAYGTLKQLGWTISYAVDNSIIGFTPRSWKKYDDMITVEADGDQLSVSSKMIHGEFADLMGRNRKNLERFVSAFETVKGRATDADLNDWTGQVADLRAISTEAARKEAEQAEEIDRVMNFSRGNLFATYAIMGINIVVFLMMVISGVSIISPNGIDIIDWGGNYGPLTLSGDAWRLFTSLFVHGGIIHLAFNLYALYLAGTYLEPMLGKARYLVVYFCCGVFASLASLWWHKTPVPSAGASGAIFGLYGLFLAFLTTRFLPAQIRKGLLQGIGIFVVFNLLYGLKEGIDNAAHVGGLLSGLLFGYLVYSEMRKGIGKKMILASIGLITIAATWYYLGSNKVDAAGRANEMERVDHFRHDDAERFDETYNSIIQMQEKALAPLNNQQLSDRELEDQLRNLSLPEWEKARESAAKLKTYRVSERSRRRGEEIGRYVDLRIEEVKLRLRWLNEKTDSLVGEINEIVRQIDQSVAELNKY